MRAHQIGLIATLVTVVSLIACKDNAPSGPMLTDEHPGALSGPVFAKLPAGCRNVHGSVDLTNIPSPNDPFGRSIGPAKGSLTGAVSSVLTSIAPGNPLTATSTDVWVGGPTDILTADANVAYTPIAGTFDFTVEATQTVTGGTGIYGGATGTIAVTGIAHDLIGPNSGPGKTNFDLEYEGTVCT